ncbi:uncharacterized protein L201_003383 [Kwoniella dendrophila CBS 6074]|uniref:Calpain catalytic domain-containing protein n=1 Tax=Kwoniella dendrophila CBS 6074 TaxID=1295534 RepID=A0AAX4JST3_9TREE
MFNPIVFGIFTLIARSCVATPIDPASANQHLQARDGGKPLWSEGGPKVEDIKQDGFKDDWFLAGLASLANAQGSSKIQDIFKLDQRGIDNIDKASITLFNIDKWDKAEKTGEEYKGDSQDVKYADITSKYSGANDNWWVAALEYAAMKIGGSDDIKSVSFKNDGGPITAWSMITGIKSKEYKIDRTGDSWKSELWRVLKSAPESYVCIKSVSHPNEKMRSIITGVTWYAVLSVQGSQYDDHGQIVGENGGDGQVTLFDARAGSNITVSFVDLQDQVGWQVTPEKLDYPASPPQPPKA